MTEPTWLDRDFIHVLHLELLDAHGGMDGIRDEGLLDSALHRPRELWSYTEPSLFALAAAYAHGIVKNHPFLDGNKRTGFMSAYTFLGFHGWTLAASEAEAVVYTVRLAAGEIDDTAYAEWLERNCTFDLPADE